MPATAAPREKRRHIVDTAYALFKRDGFHATGIDRIIAEAGVAKMTMYRHFPSKDDLIVAVLADRAARFERGLDRLVAAARTPAARVAAVFDAYGRWFHRPDFHGCLFAHALAEFGDPAHPAFAAVAAQKNALRRRLEGILASAMPQAGAGSLAATLLMLLEGATLLAELGRSTAGAARTDGTAEAAIAAAREAALRLVASAQAGR